MKINQLYDLKNDVEGAVKNLLNEKLRRVILYGSYARGDYDKESDIDFAVIANVSLLQINEYDDKLAEVCLELSLKYDVLVSVMIISEENFNGYREILPYYSHIVKEGIPIYGIQ